MDSKFKIFVIVAILLLAAGIVGSTFIVMNMIGGHNAEAVTTTDKTEYDLIEVEIEDTITTNVPEEDGMQHIAKIEISLGVDQSNKKAYKAFEKAMEVKPAGIKNEIIAAVGDQTYSMMSSKDGRDKLADEIITRLNNLLNTDIIHEVYYKDYYVQ